MSEAIPDAWDLERWRSVCARHAALFEALVAGARMGMVEKSTFGAVGLRSPVAGGPAAGATAARMLSFRAGNGGLTAAIEPFAGTSDSGLDMLFVADEGALAEIAAATPEDTLAAMKRMLRRGQVIFYVFRTGEELEESGYDDFLDSLGLAFLGACR